MKRGKIFQPSFFSYQDGLSWHLRALHCKFQMYEDCRSRGRHVLLLAQISLTNVMRTYTYTVERTQRGILDRGLVPKPFGFRQHTVLRAEEARPGQELQRSGSKLVRRKIK